MAMVAVTLIVASGITNAGFRVAGSFGVLFDTEYGNVLFTKIAIVAVMLALAYFNRFVFMPRLRRAALKGMAQITWLRRSVDSRVGAWRACRFRGGSPRNHAAAAMSATLRGLVTSRRTFDRGYQPLANLEDKCSR